MRIRTIAVAALLASTLATPAVAQDYRVRGGIRLVGEGVPLLRPQLRETPRGRAFAARFDRNRDGRLQPREADAANRAWARAPAPSRVVVVEERGAPGGWDRRALHDYRFRQTSRGAMLTLSEEVLFATDSDRLRPGALDRLRPLAGYLRSNPGVRIAIDGHTDARGTDAHNQDLSERRAASVREALDAMGVTRARFQVAGHGERQPVASNATAAGQRQNRRVEVTLLGRRAAEFAR